MMLHAQVSSTYFMCEYMAVASSTYRVVIADKVSSYMEVDFI